MNDKKTPKKAAKAAKATKSAPRHGHGEAQKRILALVNRTWRALGEIASDANVPRSYVQRVLKAKSIATESRPVPGHTGRGRAPIQIRRANAA